MKKVKCNSLAKNTIQSVEGTSETTIKSSQLTYFVMSTAEVDSSSYRSAVSIEIPTGPESELSSLIIPTPVYPKASEDEVGNSISPLFSSDLLISPSLSNVITTPSLVSSTVSVFSVDMISNGTDSYTSTDNSRIVGATIVQFGNHYASIGTPTTLKLFSDQLSTSTPTEEGGNSDVVPKNLESHSARDWSSLGNDDLSLSYELSPSSTGPESGTQSHHFPLKTATKDFTITSLYLSSISLGLGSDSMPLSIIATDTRTLRKDNPSTISLEIKLLSNQSSEEFVTSGFIPITNSVPEQSFKRSTSEDIFDSALMSAGTDSDISDIVIVPSSLSEVASDSEQTLSMSQQNLTLVGPPRTAKVTILFESQSSNLGGGIYASAGNENDFTTTLPEILTSKSDEIISTDIDGSDYVPYSSSTTADISLEAVSDSLGVEASTAPDVREETNVNVFVTGEYDQFYFSVHISQK